MSDLGRVLKFCLARVSIGNARLTVRNSPELLLGFILSAVLWTPATTRAGPLQTLATISAFPSVDLTRLYAGDILGEPGSPMKFRNGISAETCFAVPIPAAEAAKRLQLWDPSLRGTVKSLGFHPVSKACTAADFSSLSLNPAIKPQRWLLDKSMALPSRKSEFNLTGDEVRQLAGCIKAKPEPQAISACWANILLGRATGFQERGFAGVRPYETEGETVLPGEQLRSMLSERPALAQEFAPLLDGCGLLGDSSTATLEPFHYWGLYEANHHGTLTLGAVYLLPLEDRYQLLDAQYYVSGTYYTFVTLYEVWPIQVEGKTATLVWRGDFFATPTLAYTRGAERLAYGAFMLQELKKTIRSFQNEILKLPVQPEPKRP